MRKCIGWPPNKSFQLTPKVVYWFEVVSLVRFALVIRQGSLARRWPAQDLASGSLGSMRPRSRP